MMNFSTLIQNWYQTNHRKLPWRDSKEPYQIWLSEIILQQTRVEQGLSYYHKFITHYPTVHHLANASEDEVLNDWQGLGYYSRARNLHAAAKYISQQLNGAFPDSFDEILKLKGVGEYTAAAIASIAFDLPHAVVDGNVFRVLSRFLALDDAIDTTTGRKKFREAAELLLDRENPSTHNQAIMELGALVCTPRNPDCKNCPVSEQCLGLANGSYLQYPVKSKKVKVKTRYFHYFILEKQDRLMIRKRGEGDIWQGLYDFPLVEKENDGELSKTDLITFGVSELKQVAEYKHVLTHQKILASFWKATVEEFPEIEDTRIISKGELQDFPMPQLLIRYLSTTGQFTTD